MTLSWWTLCHPQRWHPQDPAPPLVLMSLPCHCHLSQTSVPPRWTEGEVVEMLTNPGLLWQMAVAGDKIAMKLLILTVLRDFLLVWNLKRTPPLKKKIGKRENAPFFFPFSSMTRRKTSIKNQQNSFIKSEGFIIIYYLGLSNVQVYKRGQGSY